MLRYKVVVQDCGSSFYFKGGDTWTARVEDAFDFGVPRCAEQFCRQSGSRFSKIQILDHCPVHHHTAAASRASAP